MLSIHSTKESEYQRYEIYGRSADFDQLPIKNMTNGSVFYAMDTAEVYMFDEETKTWLKQ